MTHPRELLVLRHAKSAWDSDAPSDYERPLSGRGVRDAPRLGRWLAEHGLVPDAVLCSPARRARETGRAACEAAGVEGAPIVFDDRIYGATVGELVRVLGDARPAARRVLLVGHNPGFEELVRWLAAEPVPVPANGKLMPTCALAWFALPEDWEHLEPGQGVLRSIIRPKELR
jgi:phosphohistidine phosphatase